MQFQNDFYPIVSEQGRGRKRIGPNHQMYIKEVPFHLESIPHGFYLTTLSKSIRLVYSMVLMYVWLMKNMSLNKNQLTMVMIGEMF